MSRYQNTNSLFLEPTTTQYGSHQVMTNVHMPNKTKLVCVDTIFADDTGIGGALPLASTPATVQIDDVVNGVSAISVVSVSLPLSFYNISASLRNNYITLVDSGGGIHTITIPDGTYTTATLPASVNTALLSAGIGNVVFSLYNSYSKLTSTSAYSYTMYLDTLSALPERSSALKSCLGWLLGYRRPASVLPAGGTLLSPAWVSLAVPGYLYLTLDDFTNGAPNSMLVPSTMGMMPRNVIARISVDTVNNPSGSVVHAFQNDGSLVSDIRRYSAQINFRKVRTQIVNAFGAPIDFNGLSYSFVMQIEHV
jgi:hypothetical protein